jgi:hypothetical protein
LFTGLCKSCQLASLLQEEEYEKVTWQIKLNSNIGEMNETQIFNVVHRGSRGI